MRINLCSVDCNTEVSDDWDDWVVRFRSLQKNKRKPIY